MLEAEADSQSPAHSFSLTPLQHAMVAATIARPRSGLYVEQWIVTLRETVDASALEQAWAMVSMRHSMLRTVFVDLDGPAPRQQVAQQAFPGWEHLDWSDTASAEFNTRWSQFLASDRRRGFDFDIGAGNPVPPLRVTLIRAPDSTRFVCTYHHSLLDGRSLVLLGRELFSRYDSLCGVVESQDHSVRPAEFREFCDLLARMDRSATRDFWQSRLEDRPDPVLPYRGDLHQHLPPNELATEEICWDLSESSISDLRDVARDAGVTLHSLMQAAWGLALAATSGVDDHVFGSVRACRKHAVRGIEDMIGMLIHTVPFRIRIDWKESLRHLLQRVRNDQLLLRDHETMPPAEIARNLGAAHPVVLFPTVLMFTDQPVSAMFSVDGRAQGTRSAELLECTDAPMTLAVEVGVRTILRLEYSPACLNSDAAKRVMGILRHLLEQFASSLDRPLAELSILDEEAETRNATWSIGPAPEIGGYSNLYSSIAAQAASRPDHVAVVESGESTTYQQLIDRVEIAASVLHARRLNVGDRVCISSRASIDWVVGILAVWRLRGVYVPIDPRYPPERRTQMLQDAAPVLVLADEPAFSHGGDAVRTLSFDDLTRCTAVSAPSTVPAAGDAAVILYTSGSTGVAKGVVLTHGNLAAQNAAIRQAMNYSENDRTTTFSSPCFDASLEEVFAPLCSGATLMLPVSVETGSLEQLLQFVSSAALTVLDMPTSLWRELTNYLFDTGGRFPLTIRALMTGGERATASTFNRFLAVGGEGIRWFNAYGPTETTICATVYEHPAATVPSSPESGLPPPIGTPIAGAIVALMDRCGRPVPVGVSGELVIGGAGVGVGYWRRDDLTAERFVDQPAPWLPSGRYYRSGDVARWRADGILEYVGREDGQIKIRGFRIEPAEIETVLARAAGVRDVIVRGKESRVGTQVLVAYVVPHSTIHFDARELESFAANYLPSHMVPRHYACIERLPLTPNGKVAESLLPDPFAVDALAEAVPERPVSDLERKVLELCRSTLSSESVGLQDDLFDLGIDSLKAMALSARLGTALNKKVSPQLLYRARTPAALAREFETLNIDEALAPLVVLRTGSSEYRPLFLIHSLGGDAWIYREMVEELDGEFAVHGLQLPGLDGRSTPPGTVEQLAEQFVALIRGVQPGGPYRLAGYSSGGVIALEMARQLVNAGETIEMLGLIDSGLPSKTEARLPPDYSNRLKGFASNLPGLLLEAWSMPHHQRVPRLKSLFTRFAQRFGLRKPDKAEDLNERELRDCFAVDISIFSSDRLKLIREHFETIEGYDPAPYSGSAQLFRSTRQPVLGTQSPTLGWEHIIRGGLSVTEIVGTHAVLLGRPQAKELAQAIGAVLAHKSESTDRS